MVNSRRLSLAVAVLLTLGFGSLSHSLAETRCQPTPQGQLCISEVNFRTFTQQTYQTQKASQWCWAACISMVYTYYKHPVSQQRIVADVYGGVVNMPSGSGFNIARQLNRKWTDDSGKSFTAQLTAAYDFDARVFAINNNWMISELDQNRPIIIGAGTHAVVGTAIQYYVTPWGPNVVSVGVFDPWPGVGARGLYPAEMTPMHLGGALRFIASVKVSDS